MTRVHELKTALSRYCDSERVMIKAELNGRSYYLQIDGMMLDDATVLIQTEAVELYELSDNVTEFKKSR